VDSDRPGGVRGAQPFDEVGYWVAVHVHKDPPAPGP
jgi:hypothetical protein